MHVNWSEDRVSSDQQYSCNIPNKLLLHFLYIRHCDVAYGHLGLLAHVGTHDKATSFRVMRILASRELCLENLVARP